MDDVPSAIGAAPSKAISGSGAKAGAACGCSSTICMGGGGRTGSGAISTRASIAVTRSLSSSSIALNKARTRGTREGRIVPFALLRRRYEEGGGPAVDPDRFQGRRGERPGWWASPPVEWEEPERRLEDAETRDVLLRAIRDLPPRQREVIALRDLAGWDAAEVCNALDLTETNQRVLLHRARSKVRTALEEHLTPNDEGPTA